MHLLSELPINLERIHYFFKNKKNDERDARWIEFKRKDKFELSENIKGYWKQAVLIELKRGKKSGYRKNHKRIVYKAITNLNYRNELLNEAFPEKIIKRKKRETT